MSDNLDQLGALARRIDPLPGGLVQLRERLRRRPSRRPFVIAAAAVACAAMAIVWLVRPEPPAATPADRTAMKRLLVDAGAQPNPRAVSLGLVAPPAPVVASDPRIAASADVVFYWVPPATQTSR